jgi:hypothetical protein
MLYRKLLFALSLLAVLSAASAAAAPPVFSATRTAHAPRIDGNDNEAEWASATAITTFGAFWDGKQARRQHRARLLWDDEALYYFAELPDDLIRPHGKQHNDRLWLGDVFELFFKPREDSPAYYELEVNPWGTMLELAFPSRAVSFETLLGGPPLGMSVATRTHDGRWVVEGRIPWSLFAATARRPAVGEQWKFQLAFYDYGADGTEPELGSCAPLTVASFHRWEDYAGLRFDAAPAHQK